ncbi:hypothetical protein HYPSUDRAFT_940154 [Hypholoma sublateritium FD-334 SS-4]|uniref:Uncharacterized protein n=1 Tax=Hypholoma sublateritium (strain FD-334 SS-4) TaxID=945553 RepID=A0A0D2LIP2_HYPSF|nr:hypothetical protein HYPSUDRAFT_940154 [Hypholoma sublateritium FD-334 SS-4]
MDEKLKVNPTAPPRAQCSISSDSAGARRGGGACRHAQVRRRAIYARALQASERQRGLGAPALVHSFICSWTAAVWGPRGRAAVKIRPGRHSCVGDACGRGRWILRARLRGVCAQWHRLSSCAVAGRMECGDLLASHWWTLWAALRAQRRTIAVARTSLVAVVGGAGPYLHFTSQTGRSDKCALKNHHSLQKTRFYSSFSSDDQMIEQCLPGDIDAPPECRQP